MDDQAATPILDTLTAMTAASLIESDLDPHTLMVTRLAALVGGDAPAEAHLLKIGPARASRRVLRAEHRPGRRRRPDRRDRPGATGHRRTHRRRTPSTVGHPEDHPVTRR